MLIHEDGDDLPLVQYSGGFTDRQGNETPFEIIKGENNYSQDNGNALKILFDDAPQTNLENSIDPTENNAPFVQHGNEPKENPNLLNLPKTRKNDWAEVINEMANQFLRKHGKLPTTAQAWDSLCNAPPAGYEITTGKDKGGEVCLMMVGKTLGRSAVNQRWSKRYTKQSQNHQT
jgi:hypothetical protein